MMRLSMANDTSDREEGLFSKEVVYKLGMTARDKANFLGERLSARGYLCLFTRIRN